MKRAIILAIALIALAVPVLTVSAGQSQTGNGGPSGAHYNLNLIGYANGQEGKVKNGGSGAGNVIHVLLYGNCKINLAEDDFDVVDNNCTDGTSAFTLPDPDSNNDGTTSYSVFAAAKGKPLGSSSTTTCFWDNNTSQEYCSLISMELSRNFGPNKFTNVSKYLLYAYVCIDGTATRVPLFANDTEDWYWSYDNNGLRVAQLRFYPGVQTTVPSPGSQISCS